MALFAGLVVAGCARHAAEEGPSASSNPYAYPFRSPGTKFGALPPQVQNTIRAQAGAAQISDITFITNGTHVVYRASFADKTVLPPLYVASDGSVLNPDLTLAMGAPADTFQTATGRGSSDTPVLDLPAAVRRAVEERAPVSRVQSVGRQPWGERTLYVVTFEPAARLPVLYITPDGTVLKEAPK